MRDTSRTYRIRGWAELALAVVRFGMFVLILTVSSGGPIFVVPGALLLGTFIFVSDGVARLATQPGDPTFSVTTM